MAGRRPTQKRAKAATKTDKAKDKKVAARKTEARSGTVEQTPKTKAARAEAEETGTGEVKTVAKETQPEPKPQVTQTDNTRDVAVPEKTSSATPRRGTMSAKEVTSEVIRNYNTNFVDPWLRAMKSWVSESEKFQQTAVDGLGKALDNGHRLAKESLEMASNIGTTIQKQMAAQVERTTELVQSMIP